MKRGFTLIEAIVAIGLFTAVMVIAIGALLVVSDANRKAQAQRQVIDNLSFVFEDISRTLRTGFDSGCSSNATPLSKTDCVDGTSIIVSNVTQPGGLELKTTYRFATTTGRNYITKKTGDGLEADIVSAQVSVLHLAFTVTGARNDADTLQPKVFFTVEGAIRTGTKYESFIRLQTTITQRNIENYSFVQ